MGGRRNGSCGDETMGGGGSEHKEKRRSMSQPLGEEWKGEQRKGRNQRHTRGHDANPLRSPETPANVTVGAIG